MTLDYKIAVVVLNWNGKTLLRQFLPSLIEHSKEATVYLADNASTDGSVPFVSENFKSVQIIENQENLGYAGGYNKALAQIEADFFILVNSDIQVTKNWLQPLFTSFDHDEQVGILQPKILDFKKTDSFEYAGACGGYRDALGYAFCRGRIFNTVEKDQGQYNNAVFDLQWASGACLAIKSQLFKELNGFDESFFAHQEEIDLCWRALHKGVRIGCVPEAVVYHVGGASLAYQSPKKTFLNFRNSLLMLLKNLPTALVFPILFSRMVLDGLAAIQFVIKGQFKNFFMVLKAHFSFYSMIAQTLKKRKHITNKKLNHYKRSIVWETYIKGKRLFSEL